MGTVKRRHVCTLEIWAEALGNNPEKLDRYEVQRIINIMAGFPEWQRCKDKLRTIKPYGRQRYYERRDPHDTAGA